MNSFLLFIALSFAIIAYAVGLTSTFGNFHFQVSSLRRSTRGAISHVLPRAPAMLYMSKAAEEKKKAKEARKAMQEANKSPDGKAPPPKGDKKK